jgi:hypothetical protein
MSWTNIPNGNLAVGAPIRSVDQLALRDNPIAIAEGDTGAPRIRAEALNGGQSGTAPIYAARAWVNFDGTITTPAIRASGNVSSITRNGVGIYTVNFTTAMPNVNYSAMLLAGSNNISITTIYENTFTDRTTSSIIINIINIPLSAPFDSNSVNVAILR